MLSVTGNVIIKNTIEFPNRTSIVIIQMAFAWSKVKLSRDIKYIDDVSAVNSDNPTFLVYDNKCQKNVLFIGSCRLVQFAFYFNSLGINSFKRNIYQIYVPNWGTDELRNKIPRDVIMKILKHTDIIICESMRHYGILNTTDTGVNFFKEFEVENKLIFRLPNLSLRMYHYEIMTVFGQPIEEVASYFKKSKDHLFTKLNELGYKKVSEFIERNLTKTKLFNTFNHPRRVLSLFMFKQLMIKFGILLKSGFFQDMNNYSFLEAKNFPIIQKDIDSYGLQFKCNISPESIVDSPLVFVTQPTDSYTFVDSDEFIIISQNSALNLLL
jgi:hypothetical protein